MQLDDVLVNRTLRRLPAVFARYAVGRSGDLSEERRYDDNQEARTPTLIRWGAP